MAYAIKVKNLSKKYKINRSKEEFLTFRERIANTFSNSKKDFGKHEEFWALKDLNFQVQPGEVVGIIGMNGAGKSTLLKILSKITPPTKGEIKFNGRTVSLLEVGTGFHPELNGRENIFLNGAIMGMNREEIRKKFDEIVEFSGVRKFLDTPVKRYSSGMSVRLAFSIAANLDPEILLLDEVLSVGDAEFQKRSLAKMKDVTEKAGRTILFVSHNMASIKNLCNRCILLQNGLIKMIDRPNLVINEYLSTGENADKTSSYSMDEKINKLPIDPILELKNIELYQNNKKVNINIANGEPLEIRIQYKVKQRIEGLRIFVDLYDNEEKSLLFRSFHTDESDSVQTVDKGTYISKLIIPNNILGPIDYELSVQAGIYNTRPIVPKGAIKIPIKVENTGKYNRAFSEDTFRGKMGLFLPWITKKYE